MIEYCDICKKSVELVGHRCPDCGRNLFARKNKVRYGDAKPSRLIEQKTN